MCCAPPGLALLITRAVPPGDPGTPTAGAFALHNVVFAAVMFLVAITLRGRGSASEHIRHEAAWLWVVVLAAAAAPRHAATTPIVVLLAALVEELVFRRSVPEMLARNLGVGWWHRGIAVLLAQASFAGTHFIGRPVDQWDGLPLLRLLAAGLMLAIIYAEAGLVPAAAVHAFINDSMRTGRFGPFDAPGMAATAAVVLAAFVMLGVQAAQRPPRPSCARRLKRFRTCPPGSSPRNPARQSRPARGS